MNDALGTLGVVVVTYNSARTIDACLAPLPLERLGDVVVVDNASSDDTVLRVRSHAVRVVEQENVGFGAGCQRGADEVTAGLSLVLFLNPDAVLAVADLERLVSYLDGHPECAVVGPRILSGGIPSYSAGRIATLATELRPLLPNPVSRLGPKRRYPPTYDRTGRVGYVEGACFLVRRDDLVGVGGFDPAYFLYFEEMELSRRLALRGREVHLCADAVVEHALGASTESTPVGGRIYYVASAVRYLRRWHGERAARTWARAARASWAMRRRTGRLAAPDAVALNAALDEALSHPPPPRAG